MLKKILFVLFVFIFNQLSAQEITDTDLYLLLIHIGRESQDEYDERMEGYKKCLNSFFVIDSNGINIRPDRTCSFYNCSEPFNKKMRYSYKTITKDNKFTEDANGPVLPDSNIVGRKFISLLDKKYSNKTLLVIETGCFIDYGNSKLEICVINKNKIAFYTQTDLTILERVE